MKKLMITIAAFTIMASSAVLAETQVRVDGAAPGQWTMDFAAAQKVAAEKKLPILLDFSGSDWCGWCKLMESNVFSKPAWTSWATNHIMMVLIDFPSDKSRVPEKYVKRNEELQEKYNVQGFPTFIILDDDGKTVMGTLGAGRDKTPASFISELNKLFRYRDDAVARYTKTLSKTDAAKYKAIIAEINRNKKAIAKNKEAIVTAQKNIEEAENKIEELLDKATEFRAAQVGDDNLKKYQELKKKLSKAEKELADWLDTDPVSNQANNEKFMMMSNKIKELKDQLGEF